MTLEEALEKLQEEICANNRLLSCYRNCLQDQTEVAKLNALFGRGDLEEQAYCQGAFDQICRLQNQFEIFFPR